MKQKKISQYDPRPAKDRQPVTWKQHLAFKRREMQKKDKWGE